MLSYVIGVSTLLKKKHHRCVSGFAHLMALGVLTVFGQEARNRPPESVTHLTCELVEAAKRAR